MPEKSQPASFKLKLGLIIALTLIAGLAGGFVLNRYTDLFSSKPTAATQAEENQYLAFLREVKTIIAQNYWQKLSKQQLLELFVLATEKVSGQQLPANLDSFAKFAPEFETAINRYSTEEEKQQATAQIADVVLANLQPQGRSRLYSKQKKQKLADRVNNKETQQDHYQALDVSPESSAQQIEQSYQEKIKKLEDQETTEAKKELAQVEKAYQTLKDEDNRQRYDTKGVNPTMSWELLSPEIFYLHITQFSPTTVQELAEIADKVDQGQELDTLIFDLRDNVGGAIDGLPYFLGPFIGKNQYAYQFIQQGEVKDFKTKTGWLPGLVRYKKIVVLVNENTQSSAEVMASVLKKYNVGVLVGTTTKGWGTIERVYPLDNQLSDQEEYSVFLVHHLTLRADGQPIQGNGVEPMISLQNNSWQEEFSRYFDNQQLLEEVIKLVAAEPSPQPQAQPETENGG